MGIKISSLLKDRKEHRCESNINLKKFKVFQGVGMDGWFLYSVDKDEIKYIISILCCPYCGTQFQSRAEWKEMAKEIRQERERNIE